MMFRRSWLHSPWWVNAICLLVVLWPFVTIVLLRRRTMTVTAAALLPVAVTTEAMWPDLARSSDSGAACGDMMRRYGRP